MDREKLKRGGQVLAPSLLTMANMACGVASLNLCHIGNFTAAATMIIIGGLFDMMDGRVARLVHGESAFGVEFDSLSDFLTFCVAPAYMLCALLLKDYGIWGYGAAFLFTLCGALRLARFNAVAQEGKGSKTHFQGLPTPGAAGFIASFVLLYEIVEQGRSARTLPFLMSAVPVLAALSPLMTVGLAFLMVSNVPYGAFKQAGAVNASKVKPFAFMSAVLVFLYFYPENALFSIGVVYVLSGLFGVLWRFIRPQTNSTAP